MWASSFFLSLRILHDLMYDAFTDINQKDKCFSVSNTALKNNKSNDYGEEVENGNFFYGNRLSGTACKWVQGWTELYSLFSNRNWTNHSWIRQGSLSWKCIAALAFSCFIKNKSLSAISMLAYSKDILICICVKFIDFSVNDKAGYTSYFLWHVFRM